MLNHTRTVLFNLPVYSEPSGTNIGEIYISPGFMTIKLKDNLQKIYDIVFPMGISRFQRNYITSIYMRLLHKPEFEPYVYFFDNRITYNIESQKYNKLFSSGISITSVKSTDCNVDFSYNYIEENVSRNDVLNYEIYNRYNIVHIKTFRGEDEFSLSNASMKHVVLIPKCLSVDFMQNGPRLEGTFSYTIKLTPANLVDIESIVNSIDNIVSHNAHIMRDLFTNVKCQEALDVFRSIWLTSKSAADRLAAALLALVFNMTYAN